MKIISGLYISPKQIEILEFSVLMISSILKNIKCWMYKTSFKKTKKMSLARNGLR